MDFSRNQTPVSAPAELFWKKIFKSINSSRSKSFKQRNRTRAGRILKENPDNPGQNGGQHVLDFPKTVLDSPSSEPTVRGWGTTMAVAPPGGRKGWQPHRPSHYPNQHLGRPAAQNRVLLSPSHISTASVLRPHPPIGPHIVDWEFPKMPPEKQ